jgi:hypothetical protein
MSSRKHDRKWRSAAAAMAAGATLGGLPVAAFALGGGDVTFTAAVPAPPGCAAPGMRPLEPMAETVKGAPYSGVGTTEVVTTLADGNRITRTNTMHYFRDSSGRMRTEYQLAAIGPFVPEESQSIVTITDPVASKRYVLHPSIKRADVFDLAAERGASVGATGKAILVGGVSTNIGAAPAPGFAPATGLGLNPSSAPAKGFRVLQPRAARGGAPSMMAPGFAPTTNTPEAGALRGGGNAPATAAAPATPGAPAGDVFFVTAGPAMAGCAAGPNVKPAPQAVSIGERRIEGLKVTGSRLEFTIGAGEVGNEQPITVRTDQWFSPDLGVVVSSTHNDPMIGETTYRLEQINRTEPDAALFAVPGDYTKTSIGR